MSADIMVVLILIAAGLIRGMFGFADALMAMPLLVTLLPARAAAPLMALIGLLIAVVILAREWQEIDIRPVATLIIAGLAGVPLGVWLLSSIDERVVKALLGSVIIGFSAWSLWRPHLLSLKSDRTALLFGLAAGILGGAYNTAGPPLVIYATLRKWSLQKFRAMMQAYCIVGSVWIATIHGVAGNITQHTLILLATAAPFVVLSTLAGQRLTLKVDAARFTRIVFLLLILLGTGLLASALLSDAPVSVPE